MLDGRYELVRRLGSGGMAEVVEARDHRLGRSVAIKRLRTDLADPSARARFHREAMTAAALAHPNIVAVYDVGEVRGAPYIVMELIDGESLAARIAADGALDPADAVDVTEQLLGALGAAHSRGLVHRDVKPANVLLTRDGTVKLADFGIAQALASTSSLTQTGQVIGTPRYLSPEQAMGAPASPQSDLYAAGLVLYEMLTGASPFAGDSPAALAAAHQQATVPRILDLQPRVSSTVANTIDRALAKDPKARFVSAAAMADALRHDADATVADMPARTTMLPIADEPTEPPPRSPSRGRGAAVLATLAGIAAAAAALALLVTSGDEPTKAQSATTATTAAPAPVVSTPPTAPPTAPPTTLPPQTVAELIALLANDPEGYGPAGPDLLERLEKIEEDPDRADHEASKTLDRLDHWVDRGQISPELAALTTHILTPLAEDDDDAEDFGPGRLFPDDDDFGD
jgi:serine/threonine protein kinase